MSEVPMGSRDDVLTGGGTGGVTSSPMAFPIPAEELGTVSIVPNGSFEAGSYQTFVLTYVAGKFGDVEFWWALQEQIRNGKIVDVFPYRRKRRFDRSR